MLSFPSAISSIQCDWMPGEGIFRINFKIFGQRGRVQVTATADRLARVLKNCIRYFEEGNLLLPLNIRKMT